MVALFFVIVVIVVVIGFIIVDVGLVEDLCHQGFVDGYCFEIVSLLRKSISRLFHGKQFLGDARC